MDNLSLPIVDELVNEAQRFGYREYVQELMRSLFDARFEVAIIAAEIEVVGQDALLEAELCRVMAKRDAIRERAILVNVPIVRSAVDRLFRELRQADDLFQIGMVALCKAVDDYVDMGYGFYTFAELCIRNEISWRCQGEKRRHYSRTRRLNLKWARLRSFDDRRDADTAALAHEAAQIVVRYEGGLTNMERQVLLWLFGMADGLDGRSLKQHEVAELIGRTRSGVSLIAKRALRKVRTQLESRMDGIERASVAEPERTAANDDVVLMQEASGIVRNNECGLTADERRVLLWTYGLDERVDRQRFKTCVIAQMLDCHESTVRRMSNRAIDKVRAEFERRSGDGTAYDARPSEGSMVSSSQRRATSLIGGA